MSPNEETLLHENNEIKIRFEKLVNEVQERVNGMKEPKISAKELKSTQILKDMCPNIFNAKNFDDIFDHLKRNHCWSWFEFGVLEFIAELYSDEKLKSSFKMYKKAVKKYCKRGVYECPCFFSKWSPLSSRPFAVKFTDDIKNMSLNDLKKLVTNKLIPIINIKLYHLLPLAYTDGCAEFIFSIPKSITTAVFPLSTDQKGMLDKIGVKKCDLYFTEVIMLSLSTVVNTNFNLGFI